MTLVDIIPAAIAGLSLLALIVREGTKAFWGKELIAAKDAQIAAKDAQIQLLQDINPTKTLEYLKSTKEGLGQQIDELEEELVLAREEAAEKQELAATVESLVTQIRKLEGDRETVDQTEKIIETLWPITFGTVHRATVHLYDPAEQSREVTRAIHRAYQQANPDNPMLDPFSDDPPTAPES